MSRPVGQAVSERRPLRRRPVTMARPARVRIRNRNPWTLARRRLFGWKVRLPLATAISPRHISGDGHRGNSRSTAAAPVAKLPANRRGPVSGRCRAARGWATLMRVLRSLPQVKPRCSAPARLVDKSRSRCWHNGRNLLTSASAVKRDRGFARLPPPHEDLVPICCETKTLSPDLYTAVNNLVDSFSGASGPRGLPPMRGICCD